MFDQQVLISLAGMKQQVENTYQRLCLDWEDPALAEYFGRTPASRIRPMLLLASFATVNSLNNNLEKAVTAATAEPILIVAACLEQLHAAFLGLDDLIDKAHVRRYGLPLHLICQSIREPSDDHRQLAAIIKQSILELGEALLAVSACQNTRWLSNELWKNRHVWYGLPTNDPIDRLVGTVRQVLANFETTWLNLNLNNQQVVIFSQYQRMLEESLDAELLERQWTKTGYIPTLEELNWLMIGKTCSYSTIFPLTIGGLLVKPAIPSKIISSLRNFGLAIGLAYQMQDDLLVFSQDSAVGKCAQLDLFNSTMCYPLVVHYYRLPTCQRSSWYRLVRNCRNSHDAQQVIDSLNSANTLSICRAQVNEQLELARTELFVLQSLGFNTSLLQVLSEACMQTRNS